MSPERVNPLTHWQIQHCFRRSLRLEFNSGTDETAFNHCSVAVLFIRRCASSILSVGHLS